MQTTTTTTTTIVDEDVKRLLPAFVQLIGSGSSSTSDNDAFALANDFFPRRYFLSPKLGMALLTGQYTDTGKRIQMVNIQQLKTLQTVDRSGDRVLIDELRQSIIEEGVLSEIDVGYVAIRPAGSLSDEQLTNRLPQTFYAGIEEGHHRLLALEDLGASWAPVHLTRQLQFPQRRNKVNPSYRDVGVGVVAFSSRTAFQTGSYVPSALLPNDIGMKVLSLQQLLDELLQQAAKRRRVVDISMDITY